MSEKIVIGLVISGLGLGVTFLALGLLILLINLLNRLFPADAPPGALEARAEEVPAEPAGRREAGAAGARRDPSLGRLLENEGAGPTAIPVRIRRDGNMRPKPEIPDSRETGAGERVIAAPMPGDIIEIRVKPGDSVRSGEVVCVLEAMKMKNLIYAPHSGVIASVEVNAGQAVGFGAALVTYE